MGSSSSDEWTVITTLLPAGWREASKEQKAFRRARYMDDPGSLLRLLLFHAVNDSGLRETTAQARASGIAQMSQVALLKRLRTCGPWLAWLGAELCRSLREQPRLPHGFRLRVLDSTTVQGPASKGTEWRVHYALNLVTLCCDWFELTDVHGAELLERTPVQPGDVLMADRSYFRSAGARVVVNAGAHLLVRLKSKHAPMCDTQGRPFRAFDHAVPLRVGQVKAYPVRVKVPGGPPLRGRVILLRLPAPLAAKAERRAQQKAQKKGRPLQPRSLQASHFVMLFTTLPKRLLSPSEILELYRFRWQVELAFKRLKQLLKLGHLPHKNPDAAQGWIHAKLVVALLLETLYRNAQAFSPWGYALSALRHQTATARHSAQLLAMDRRSSPPSAAGSVPVARPAGPPRCDGSRLHGALP